PAPTKQALTPSQWLKVAAASLDCLQANVIIANPRFEIVYLNACSKGTLTKLAAELRRAFNVEVGDMVGLSIHHFHRDKDRVERILTNHAALPHRALFTFGDVTVELHANRIAGTDEETLGYVVTWDDVTERESKALDDAGKIAALQQSQAIVE